MAAIKSVRDLDAGRVGIELVVLVYSQAKWLPPAARFDVSAQMRTAAVSVPSNVAEGQATGTLGRYASHVRLALGSVGELSTLVEVAKRLERLKASETEQVEEPSERTAQLLHALHRSITSKPSRRLRG